MALGMILEIEFYSVFIAANEYHNRNEMHQGECKIYYHLHNEINDLHIT